MEMIDVVGRMIIEAIIAFSLTLLLIILHEYCHYIVAKKYNCKIVESKINKLVIESADPTIERKIKMAPYFVILPLSVSLILVSYLLPPTMVGKISLFVVGIVMIVTHIISYFYEGRKYDEKKVQN